MACLGVVIGWDDDEVVVVLKKGKCFYNTLRTNFNLFILVVILNNELM